MSVALPLVQGTEIVPSTEPCAIKAIHYWNAECKIKGRYKLMNGHVLCGRHYKMLYRNYVDVAPNTLGLPAWIQYGQQRKWILGTPESQAAYLADYAGNNYFTPGQLIGIIKPGDGAGPWPVAPFDLNDEELNALPYTLNAYSVNTSPLGKLHFVNMHDGSIRKFPTLCFVCGHNGSVLPTRQIYTNEKGRVNVGYAHVGCRTIFNENKDILGIRDKPCGHYVLAAEDDAAQAASANTPDSTVQCHGCGDSFVDHAIVTVSWSTDQCPDCMAKVQGNQGMVKLKGKMLCPGCYIQPYYFGSHATERMKNACKLWEIDPGRPVAKDLANFYTLEYLSIQHEWVVPLKSEVVSEIAEAYLKYACAACGGEFRYITSAKDAPEKATAVTKAVYEGLKNKSGPSRFDAWNDFKALIHTYGPDAMAVLVADFHRTNSGGVGGQRWANCAKVAELYMRKNISDQEFVDMVFGLQHNGGSFLNKAFALDYGSISLKTLLDNKRALSNPLFLLWIAAPPVLDAWLKAAAESPDDEVLQKGAKRIEAGRSIPHLNRRFRVFEGVA